MPFVAYAMWLLWSALSRFRPSQHSGKRTCRRRNEPFVSGHVGTVLDGGTPASTPQFQYVTFGSCGAIAFESPAIIRRLFGNVCTSAVVPRR